MWYGRIGGRRILVILALNCAAATAGEFPGLEVESGSRVTELRPEGLRYGSIAVSPDRRRLACVRLDHGRRVQDILLVPLDGQVEPLRVLVQHGAAPAWLSDDRVLFLRDDDQGHSDIWLASLGEPREQALTATPAVELGVSVAPDGIRLLFTRADPIRDRAALVNGHTRYEIVLAEVRGDQLTGIKVVAREDSRHRIPSSAHWSPDGKRILYSRLARRDWRNDLYVMNADGSDDRLLVRDATLLAWTADGRSVLYQRRSRTDRNGAIRLIGIDGQGDRRVLADAYVPPSGTFDAQWNRRRDRLALATEALVGGYDASGFATPTGIILLGAEAAAIDVDLRRTGLMEVLEGGVQWDARDRVVFARHVATEWRDRAPRGGIFSMDPSSGAEQTVLADTETYSETITFPPGHRPHSDR
jgi:hypothetical protein